MSRDIRITEPLVGGMSRLVAHGREMAQKLIDYLAHEAEQRIGIGCG
jgi:hypothetical protein